MAKPKVLVVEDEGIIAADIQNTLGNLGYEICGVVDSGEAAIEAAGEKLPDLILMDIILRGRVDGIEAAKAILGLYHIPVVYLSAHEDDKTIERTKDTKPYGFILKPFSERDLKTSLKMALFQHDSERMLQESEERYFRLTENAPDVIFRMILPEGRYEYVSKASFDILGYSPLEFYKDPSLIGKILHPDWKQYYQFSLKNISEGNISPTLEYRIIHKSGETRWINQRNVIVKNQEGKPAALEGIITDINRQKNFEETIRQQLSHQKEIEEQLLKIERRNSIIINTIPDMLFQFDREGKFIDFKVKEEAELFVSPSEFLNRKIEDVLPAEIARAAKHHIEKAFETNELQVFTYELPGKDRIKIYETRLAVSGENEVLAMVRDITTSVQAEKSLKESEEKYRRLTQNAPIALTRLPINKRNYEFVNDEFVKQSGYTLEEFNNLTDKQVTELIYEKDREHVYKVYDEWAKSGFKGVNHIIYRIINKAGKLKWLDTYHYADFAGSGEMVAINQIYIDITGLKNVEESLRQSEEKFRTVSEITPVAVYMLQGTKFVYVNKYVEKVTGYTCDELIDTEFIELVHPDYKDKVKQIAAARQRGEEVPGRYEIRIITKKGEEKIVEINATRFDYGGKSAILGTALDITERKNAEAALKESEEMFRTVAESMPAEIIVYQGDKFVYANPFAETLTGYKIDELMQMDFWENTHPDYRDLARDRGRARQKGEHVPQRYELKINTKSGEERWVDYSAALFNYKSKPAVLGTAIDITSAKKAEEALRTGEERYKAFIYHSSEGIYRIELEKPVEITLSVDEQLNLYYENSYIAECNEIMAKMYGFNASGELIGKKVDELLIRTDPHNEEFMKKFLDGYKIIDYESHEVDRNGKPVYFLNNAVGIVEGGKLLRVWGTQRDITELKKTEEKLKSSLFEKEILLKEIHHRVKNNLQIITSLIKLQSGYIKDKLSLELFNESYNRVQSMALVHQKLYQSKDLARIDFGEYTRTLVTHLAQSLGVNQKSIAVNIETDNVYLSIDIAIPCGLIINELLTNAVKHAFRKEKRGEIQVKVCSADSRNYIEVLDNGCGLPKGFDIRNLQSFGLKLVSTLTGQLKGNVEAYSNDKTVFKITFPANKEEFEEN